MPQEFIKKEGESFNFNKTLLEYQKQGLELESKFKPEIQESTQKISKYLKEDSIESALEKLKNIQQYPVGAIMSHSALGYFSGEELTVGINPGGESGYCVLLNPYNLNDDETGSENIPENVQNAISEFVPFEQDRKKVDGVVWTSGGIMNRFDKKSDIPHNGLWVSSVGRGSGLGYGLYRLQENIFGILKTEQASTLSLLKTYLRLGFIPKSILNPITNEMLPNLKTEEVVRNYLEKKQETLDFHIYLERELVGGQKI